MNSPSSGAPGSLESHGGAPAVTLATQPFYWSVRRELWENRSIYIAPLLVAGVVLLGFMAGFTSHAAMLNPAQDTTDLAKPYGFTGVLMMFVAIIVSVFYCLDALHGERRDRSILFWKSLPVSDVTTVLSKASIPIIVLPLVFFVVGVAMQFAMLLLQSAFVLAKGQSVTALWTELPLLQIDLVLFYGLTVHALWQAPLYSWLLLVSGWARRAVFLWAVSPLVALGIFEKLVLHTSNFPDQMMYLFFGGCSHAFMFHMKDDIAMLPPADLTPGKLLAYPGLWIGLLIAAGLLAAAARLRRDREPI
jgi:ABC-2 type transport system permease protein